MPTSPVDVYQLVADVKTYVADQKHRMKLAYLMAETTNSVLGELEAAELPTRTNAVQLEFGKQVTKYEAVVAPLAQSVGILGRWAIDNDMNTVAAIVRALLKYAHKEGSGQTVLLNLRSYPALLVVTAYGVVLVDAHRWSVLHDFLSESVNGTSHGETSRIVECLFLGAWHGYEHRLWQTLEGWGNTRRRSATISVMCSNAGPIASPRSFPISRSCTSRGRSPAHSYTPRSTPSPNLRPRITARDPGFHSVEAHGTREPRVGYCPISVGVNRTPICSLPVSVA